VKEIFAFTEISAHLTRVARCLSIQPVISRFVLIVASVLVLAPITFIRAQEVQAVTSVPSPGLPPGVAAASNPAEATRAWLASIPASEKIRSDAYFEGGYWLLLWNFLLTAAIMLFALLSGFSARIRDFAERATHFRFLQAAIYAAAFVLVVAVLSFPLDYYQNFMREHQYGMATQDFAGWFFDWIKALIVQLIAFPILLMALYFAFRRAAERWWLVGAVVMMIFFVIAAIISPVYVEPLFNKYTPLQNARIRDSVLQLARANEIPVDKVFVVDASRQTKRVSANVSGLGSTTRIALNDNLLHQCSLPEIRQVMAHEMGHYVLNHIFKFFAFIALLALIAFALAKLLFDWAVARWGDTWRVRGIADPAGWPLLVLIFSALAFLGTPVLNTLVRVQEREADAFGLNAAREPDAEAAVALKLGRYRKMEPTPLEEFIFFDHPSGRSRIRMAMDWKYAMLPARTSELPARRE